MKRSIMQSIKRKIQIVYERVNRLEEMSKKIPSFPYYQSNQFYKDITERNVHIAIEACLDIARIIISKEKLEEPSDFKGLFMSIAQAGIIDPEMLGFLIPMAGTKNILVHSYDKIDDSIIYGILKKHLSSIMNFIDVIKSNYLNKV